MKAKNWQQSTRNAFIYKYQKKNCTFEFCYVWIEFCIRWAVLKNTTKKMQMPQTVEYLRALHLFLVFNKVVIYCFLVTDTEIFLINIRNEILAKKSSAVSKKVWSIAL